VTALLLAGAAFADPAPGMLHSKHWVRSLDCERLTVETASQRYPGEIVAAAPRGDFVERSAVVCRQRLTPEGLRDPRDEAVLGRLDALTTDLAATAEALRPDLKDRTWVVEAYYPSAVVAAKIAFATNNALNGRGLPVSDRKPALAAGDIDILVRLSADEAFPAACRRYFGSGSLREGDALLAVVTRDLRETILHAGLCTAGTWTWLR
jgi:hypothetical protein